MEHSPLKANSFSASQKNFLNFMKHESSSPCLQQPNFWPVLSQIIPFHALPSYFFKIHFNIFPSMLMSFKRSLFSKISHQTPSVFFSSPYMSDARPNLHLLDLITRRVLGEEYKNHEHVLYLSFSNHLLLPPS